MPLELRHAGQVLAVIPASVASAEEPTFSGDVSLAGGFTVPAGETWSFDPNVSTTVHVRANVVVAGTLRLLPANPGVVHHLVFEGVDEGAFVGGGNVVLASDVGLWVVGAGQLDARGALKTAWTRALGALAAGATQLTVEDATGWRPGDVVAIAPTAPVTTSDWWDRYDVRTVASVAGNVVGFGSPLANAHPAPVFRGVAHRAEVLNLTRNVRVTGTPQGRSHVTWLHAESPVDVSDVEVAYMGVPGVLGRYPVHFHHMGDASQGSTVAGVVVHDSGSRAFVPHASHGIALLDCVAHDVTDDAYWWDLEENGSIDNATDACLWSGCVASKVDGGYRLGGFLLGVATERTGQLRNTIVDCVAVGVKGDPSWTDTGAGENSNDPGGFVWPELDERGDSVWVFERNVAHNCFHNGFETWQNGGPVHDVDDSVIYHCTTAINHGAYGNDYRYRRIHSFGCYRFLWEHAASGGAGQRFEDCDAAVVGLHACNLNSVTGGPVDDRVVQFLRCKFRGHTAAAVRAWGEGGTPADDEFPGKWDLHDTDWDPARAHVALLAGATPTGTVVREFEGGVLVATHSV